jgi:hypothetical protein
MFYCRGKLDKTRDATRRVQRAHTTSSPFDCSNMCHWLVWPTTADQPPCRNYLGFVSREGNSLTKMLRLLVWSTEESTLFLGSLAEIHCSPREHPPRPERPICGSLPNWPRLPPLTAQAAAPPRVLAQIGRWRGFPAVATVNIRIPPRTTF